jgi:molybdenum cofactor guanylyltransferase/molybdopterin-guanine dinucleotide biosynthesis protein MobB
MQSREKPGEMRREAPGVLIGALLAGGRSARMGEHEKAMLDIAGAPMLAHVIARLRPQVHRLLINANGDPARLRGFGLPVVADAIEGQAGPLAGLHASLSWALGRTPGASFIVSVPADTPFLPLDLVARLLAAVRETGATSAIAASMGRRHPVVGLWDVGLFGDLGEALHFGMRAMHRFAEKQGSIVVDFPLLEAGDKRIDPFFNVNTPADLETVRALFAENPGVADAPAPILGIVGWKGSGKTTLIERLVAILTQRGLKIATLKHSHHPLRPHDGATDGERHARAGASAVGVLAPEEWEISGKRQSSPPPDLKEAAARLEPADLILVEGFKSAAIPKIEVRREGETESPLAAHDPYVIAVATDQPADAGKLPVFKRDDAAGIAAFIVSRIPHLRS